ncbi:MAG: PepSY domain-containing protein [Methyloprofundus sp.]|nr:PepSY domain-containing protein [Methyloprofundus sp.]
MKTFICYLYLFLLLMHSSHIHAAPANISQQQAVSIAQQAQSGRVLGVKQKNDRYRVKMLLDNGEVKIILIDVQSGKIKSRH